MAFFYDRQKALEYSNKWALGRNDKYYDFTYIGGDCTSFVSQCIYAGCGEMNYTPVTGWYYKTASDRTPSWTGVQYLYQFLVTNRGRGPSAEEIPLYKAEIGDIIQLGDGDVFYHSLFIAQAGDKPSDVLINAHTIDSYLRPVSTYYYENMRVLHIK